MTLQDKIQAELKVAIKAQDAARKGAVRILIGEFQRQPEKTLTDEQVIAIIKKLIKSEKELLAAAKEETSDYLTIMEGYLPRQASREEIKTWIAGNIDFSAFGSRMQAMRPIMAHFGSTTDGNTVKEILQNID
ncbi:MAG: GatB/YqeY domain-containing protein [Desulfoprunum sp.]|nr:GatB/YqeY domain-containing protein [Desulfoprunum sp.]